MEQQPRRPPQTKSPILLQMHPLKITYPCPLRFHKVARLCFGSVYLNGVPPLLWITVYIPQGYASCSSGDGVHKDCRIRSWNDCLFSGSTLGLCTSKKLRGRQSGRGGASVLPLLCSYWPLLNRIVHGRRKAGAVGELWHSSQFKYPPPHCFFLKEYVDVLFVFISICCSCGWIVWIQGQSLTCIHFR